MDELVPLEEDEELIVDVFAREGNEIQWASTLDAEKGDGWDATISAEMAKWDGNIAVKCDRDIGGF